MTKYPKKKQIIVVEQINTQIGKVLNWNYKTVQQMDVETENFVEFIQEMALKNISQTKRKESGIKYPLEIKELVSQKTKARIMWENNRTKENKTILNLDSTTHSRDKKIKK